jgi:septum formation protein
VQGPAGCAIVLASASPRRRELLARAGLCFEVLPAEVDESLAPGTLAEAGAVELAERKAKAVHARLAPGRRAWVLAADTIVALGEGAEERLLGKPADEDEARAMLGSLSGTRHRVITGVCVADPEGARLVGSETTGVRMRAIDAREVDAYVRSGEWRDKAGGYAIQESADRFVVALEGGGFDNVVGLPVELALALLRRAGAPPPGEEQDGSRGPACRPQAPSVP